MHEPQPCEDERWERRDDDARPRRDRAAPGVVRAVPVDALEHEKLMIDAGGRFRVR